MINIIFILIIYFLLFFNWLSFFLNFFHLFLSFIFSLILISFFLLILKIPKKIKISPIVFFMSFLFTFFIFLSGNLKYNNQKRLNIFTYGVDAVTHFGFSENIYKNQYPEKLSYPRSFSLYSGFGIFFGEKLGLINDNNLGKSTVYKINIFALKTYFLFFLSLLIPIILVFSNLKEKNLLKNLIIFFISYFILGHFLIKTFTAGFFPQFYNLIIFFSFILFLRFYPEKKLLVITLFFWPLFESYPFVFPAIFLGIIFIIYRLVNKKIFLSIIFLIFIFGIYYFSSYINKENPLKLFNIHGGIERFFHIDLLLFLLIIFVFIFELLREFKYYFFKYTDEFFILFNYFLFYIFTAFLYFSGNAVYYAYYKVLNSFSTILIFYFFIFILTRVKVDKIFYLMIFFLILTYFYGNRIDEIYNKKYSFLGKENLNGIVILLDDPKYKKNDYLYGFFSQTEGIISNAILSRKFSVDNDYPYSAEGYKINPESYIEILKKKIKEKEKIIIYDPYVYFRYTCNLEKIRDIIKDNSYKVIFYPSIAGEDDPNCFKLMNHKN